MTRKSTESKLASRAAFKRALQEIARKWPARKPATEYTEWYDMDSAYGNGLDIGEANALKECATIARAALNCGKPQ